MEVNYTPKKILELLDRNIIGQNAATRSVAVALRNRYRRTLLEDCIKEEILPKNILMIGPTGVGKTEIARRLALLVKAPFIKGEATKFTEVGYVGRDVESMVRDLVEMSVRMVKEEKMEEVKGKASEAAHKKRVKLLVTEEKKQSSMRNRLEMLFTNQEQEEDGQEQSESDDIKNKRKRPEHQLSL